MDRGPLKALAPPRPEFSAYRDHRRCITGATESFAIPPYPNLGGTPLWMVSLWVCFGIMLRPVFEWFLDHCMRSILGFSLGGVIAYWSGQQLGVLEFTNSWITALGIAAEWAIAGIIFRFLHLKFPTHSEYEHS